MGAADVTDNPQNAPRRDDDPTSRELGELIFQSATRLLSLLFPQQVDLRFFPNYAIFPFESENRFEWYYLPASLIPRSGLPLRAMNPTQQQAALELLQQSLSATGFQKANNIRMLELVLHEIEKNLANPFRRDAEAYHFTIFGTPSKTGAWGWRYEGHHTSLHWTMIDGEVISSTPQFFGASPATVTLDVHGGPPLGTRVLGAEEDLARELILSLTEDQRPEAILLGPDPQDILTLNQRRASIQESRGISYAAMRPPQRDLLQRLVRTYADVQPGPIARDRMLRIEKAGWDGVRFAWTGSREMGRLHYYRIILINSFLIEYDTPMGEPFHRHTVWRDFLGDWGQDRITSFARVSAPAPPFAPAIGDWGHSWGPDLLRQHYLTSHHHNSCAQGDSDHRYRTGDHGNGSQNENSHGSRDQAENVAFKREGK